MAQGNAQFQAGDLEAARETFKRVLELDPGHARAWYMLSGIAANEGETASAIGLLQRALALQPALAEFHFALAGLLASTGRMAEALPSYQAAARLQPAVVDYSLSAAGALLALGQTDDALSAYRVAARAAAHDARAHFELGKALQMCNRFKEAEQALEQAALLAPGSGEIQMHLAVVRRDQGRPVEAEAPARRAIELAPGMYQGWFVLGSVLAKQGRHTEAAEQFRKVIAANPEDNEAVSGLLFSMNYSDQFSAKEVFAEHLKFGDRYPPAAPISIPPSRRSADRRLKVAYLSADFRRHPIADFMEPILKHHDRRAFEVCCYFTGAQSDFVTARLQGQTERWRSVAALSNDELERVLRDDQIDILVELSGHTDGQRLDVLAHRVAPIQVTYLGYPGTTGLRAIDYRITDALADPAGEADLLHVEKLLRLPEGFLCYGPPAVELEPAPVPMRENGYVTFGSFNNFAKVSPTTITLWSRILRAVPGSKLLIKTQGLQDAGLRSLLLERFAAHGIEPERVILRPPVGEHIEHMRAYGEVDVALDTFPYHGTTTTMDALWMGVPVVTLAGDRHLSRVGVSILSALGLQELVATTPDQYVATAVALAADQARLDALRRGLRTRMTRSAATDGARFTAQLEQAYRDIWQEALRSSESASGARTDRGGTAEDPAADQQTAAVSALISRGNTQFEAGDLDAARASFNRLLDLNPKHAGALYALSGIAARKGDIGAAAELASRAIALQPSNGDFHHLLGQLLVSQKRFEPAIDSFQRAVRLNPAVTAWRLDVEATMVDAGRMDEAASVYRASGASGAPDARAYFDLGDALLQGGRNRQAEEAFAQSEKIAPESAATHLYVALARRDQGIPVDAEAPARLATRVAPDMPQGWLALGTVLAMQGRHTEAVAQYRQALALDPDSQDAWDGLLGSMNYSTEFSARQLFEAHLEWGRRVPPAQPMEVWPSHRASGHRLRVGYLPGDYFNHGVAYFLEPLLEAHDRSRFEIFGYHVGGSEDAVTRRLASRAEHWRRLKGVSDDDLEKELRRDQIDVLVELAGHTHGHRLAVLGRRVAPVQVTYLGYPNTTGLKAIDYRITDARADPPGEADALHVEQLVRLPNSFLCYLPPPIGPETRTPPSQRRGYVTFGSFNNFAKISGTSIALWARILAAVPDSKILIKAKGLQDSGLRALVSARFREAGISEQRLVLGPPAPDAQQHLHTYDEVDIALDTFPYHGTTTTLEALWMNVPVITLAGDRHASRVGVSILSTMGLQQLIAHTPEEYIALAAKLAGDGCLLEEYAAGLRATLRASPLMDGSRITRDIEQAYLQMWETACTARPPW